MTDTAPAAKPAKRVTENSEYVAAIIRMLYGYGQRVGDDPAALAHFQDLKDALRDATNLGIYLANKGPGHYSINDQAVILDITKQSVHARVKLGRLVHDRIEAARAIGPVFRLADFRARRAARLAARGITDRTGSDRERMAGGA